MPFLFFISGVAGGALVFGLTGVFLRPALLAVGFNFFLERMPSEQPTPYETGMVDIRSR